MKFTLLRCAGKFVAPLPLWAASRPLVVRDIPLPALFLEACSFSFPPPEQTPGDKVLSHCMGGGIQLPRRLGTPRCRRAPTCPRVDLAPWSLRRPRPPAPRAQWRELAPCASGVQFAGVRTRALCCPRAFPDFEPTLPPQRSLAGPRRERVASDSPTAGAGLWPPAGARGSPRPGWQCQTANRQQKSTSSRAIAGHAPPQALETLSSSCDCTRRSGPGAGEEAEDAKRCRRPAVTCEGRVCKNSVSLTFSRCLTITCLLASWR